MATTISVVKAVTNGTTKTITTVQVGNTVVYGPTTVNKTVTITGYLATSAVSSDSSGSARAIASWEVTTTLSDTSKLSVAVSVSARWGSSSDSKTSNDFNSYIRAQASNSSGPGSASASIIVTYNGVTIYSKSRSATRIAGKTNLATTKTVSETVSVRRLLVS